ncbi:uncharacterized protein LOC107612689 [Arachis ipaensis]|uniref:uncharacterized protein LOC107612689 n=1 Tax=Arachis ipaensis TaxID=130454 RepID=UPI0007AF29A9|nr:uncharacterized protein LOC107612689 [Arachis ipaensis]XP_025628678.1 uncharacterized protein LOC112721868 [Arachis hypogaea]
MLSFALANSWPIKQLDVNNAFLYGDLLEDVYMSQPKGYEQGDGTLVCKLTKALYSLKQSPWAWYVKLLGAFKRLGFTPTKSKTSFFTRIISQSRLYALVYFDDIILTGDSGPAINQVIQQLNLNFALKDLGDLHYFLGVQVVKTADGGLSLLQTKYIQDILKKAGLEGCKPCSTPLPSTLKLTATWGVPFDNPSLYRSVVGSLQYLTMTRPKISYPVNRVCQFMQSPSEDHWKVVKRILRYLSGTLHHGLHLKKGRHLPILAYCDSDWGSDPDDRKSTSGTCVFLGRNSVSWSSKKQTIVACSSSEAEYRSMVVAVADVV